ncbi:MAG: hypothetical protein KGL48_10210 [Sphingomonadales bacterium]|nr:hypothetical protein [Sphingomonadales bacterium]MDE2570613.1 hypothetical protein [Sphingomonadales bacterium]
MTALRTFSNHFVAAASAFALSFAMFSVTVSTPSAPVPVHTASAFA